MEYEVKDKVVTVESLNHAYQNNLSKINILDNDVDDVKEDIQNIIDSQGSGISSLTASEIMAICQQRS